MVVLTMGLSVWSNHFLNSFHGDDIPNIVENHAIRSLGNFPRFFTNPRTFSSDPEFADYKPLLVATYAFDASRSPSLNAVDFQMDSFLWFSLLVLSVYLLFRMMPGTSTGVALVGAALIGMHPLASEAVNYVSRRGYIMGAAGVSLAMALWIIWPRRLPQRLGLNIDRVPQSWIQFQIRTNGWRMERAYKRFLALPLPWYLLALIPGLLSEPSTAVFVLILAVYIRLFDPEIRRSRLIVPAALCGSYWVVQTAVSLHASPLFRVSAFTWWTTQPWIVLRYFASFFWPALLGPDSGLAPASLTWPPFAALGVAGVAVLVLLAARMSRFAEWRSVGFGIWWFVISLLPTMLVPERSIELAPRMLLASVGLAFATAHFAGLWFGRFYAFAYAQKRRRLALTLGCILTLPALGGLGFLTWQRNAVWISDSSFWFDVTERSPGNGRAFLNYAAAMAADGDLATSAVYVERAVPLSTNDALLQIRLGQSFDRLNRAAEAEAHFRRAIALAPNYAAAYSGYGRWLMTQRRIPEAFEVSTKSIAMNPNDLEAHRNLLEIYADRSEWPTVLKLAKELLVLDPEDPLASRLLTLAESSAETLRNAEAETKKNPVVDDFLKLAVVYYRNQRYQDCVEASRKALAMRPNLAEAWANMAAAQHAMGQDDDAIVSLREVLRLRPDMKFAQTDLDILLAQKKDKAASR